MNFNAAGAMASGSAHKPETFLLSPGAEQSLPQSAQLALQQVDNLKYFLISGPVDWSQDQFIRRFLLPTGEYVSCVLWNNLFHISGTDIVRCLAFRFQAFGRPVKNTKKFEEGIFSDLRNLKAGNDASLEEPKSAFLDFLYKHNCIRTQKKQKVFYWYSVSHDRLFLDALERDLKREKAGQEATSTAVAEPALSFEYDSSQSLYEQLTKAQQESGAQPFDMTTGNSSASANAMDAYAAASAMSSQPALAPPSQMVSQTMSTIPQDSLNDMAYSQPQQPHPQQMMNPAAAAAAPMTQFPSAARHDMYGMSSQPQPQPRHGSMPAPYMEYSPAPSFVSSQSHYEDYSNPRGVSYEPITPPQQATQYTPEPAYASNDGSMYTNMPADMSQSFGHPAANADFGVAQSYPSKAATAMYSHIHGSPTYRGQPQRVRKPSYSSGANFHTGVGMNGSVQRENPHAAHRPSDLRRAVSASLSDHYYNQTPTPEVSRHSSPMTSVESRQHSVPLASSAAYVNDGFAPLVPAGDGVGPFRRARSATTTELFSPYSQKTHSCPIPNCGRQFKRLEHLKRHVRTHTQERPYVCPQCNKAFSRSDNLAQHRRTHEEQPDGTFPAEDDLSNEEDAVTGLDDPSGSYGSGHVHGLGMMTVPGSMGPPPLPAPMGPGGF